MTDDPKDKPETTDDSEQTDTVTDEDLDQAVGAWGYNLSGEDGCAGG
jgi:hypothetical protein